LVALAVRKQFNELPETFDVGAGRRERILIIENFNEIGMQRLRNQFLLQSLFQKLLEWHQ
jgi:hypothetical protein